MRFQKSNIEKETANLFKGIENNHLKVIQELESLYEKKIEIEANKYLKLED